MNGILYTIGVGPGDPELLILKAINKIKNADVIACPSKDGKPGIAYQIALKAVPEIENKECLLLDFPMRKDKLEDAHNIAVEQIIEKLDSGKNVALLTLGDPCIYSTAFYVIERIKQEGYQVDIINGVPSFCVASAKLLQPLALGEEELLITTGEYKNTSGTNVIMKAGRKLSTLKKEIAESGRDAYLIENLGMENETIITGIQNMPDDAGYFSILIVE